VTSAMRTIIHFGLPPSEHGPGNNQRQMFNVIGKLNLANRFRRPKHLGWTNDIMFFPSWGVSFGHDCALLGWDRLRHCMTSAVQHRRLVAKQSHIGRHTAIHSPALKLHQLRSFADCANSRRPYSPNAPSIDVLSHKNLLRRPRPRRRNSQSRIFFRFYSCMRRTVEPPRVGARKIGDKTCPRCAPPTRLSELP
jgi:hypothetical protein